jgi:lipoic acid synthetase
MERTLGTRTSEERHYDGRLPRWLHQPIRAGKDLYEVNGVLRRQELHTVCEQAKCPNRMECFSRRTATFMLLGDCCTRNCAFCSVRKGTPGRVDEKEPQRVAEAAVTLGLEHVVMTSVTRDDLADGGASHFAAAIKAVRQALPGATVEVLTPDFSGDQEALRVVIEAGPDVFNHNLETVRELYPRVRPMADYRRSLGLLEAARDMDGGIRIKSGVMVGLGETRDQLRQLFRDLAATGCHMLTLGQYLRPSRDQLKVERFLPPGEFAELGAEAEEAGIPLVASGPLVRSSYRAGELLDRDKNVNNVDCRVDHKAS